MVLKKEADLSIAKLGQLLFAEPVGIVAVQCDTPAGWRFQAAHDVQQRALADAGRTHDGRRFTALHRKRHAGQHRERSTRRRVFLGDLRNFKHFDQAVTAALAMWRYTSSARAAI